MDHGDIESGSARVRPARDGDEAARTPVEHRYFAMAVRCQHPRAKQTWCVPAAIADEMREEADGRKYIESITQMNVAHAKLLDDYKSGRLQVQHRDGGQGGAAAAGRLQAQPGHAGLRREASSAATSSTSTPAARQSTARWYSRSALS